MSGTGRDRAPIAACVLKSYSNDSFEKTMEPWTAVEVGVRDDEPGRRELRRKL